MIDAKQDRRLLKVPEAARDYLGLSERKVWSLISSGELPAVRIGRAVRVDARDIDALIERLKDRARDGEGGGIIDGGA